MIKKKQKTTSAQKKTIKKNKKQKTTKLNKNKEFEFFEHTADVKFKAHGKTFEKALANTAKATVQVMTDVKKIKKKQKKQINIAAKTKESLVYNFLEQIIFLIDTEGFLMCEIKKMKLTKKKNKEINQEILSLNAELLGDNAKNYDVHTCIKAVTYSDMQIEENKKECTIQVVLDI